MAATKVDPKVRQVAVLLSSVDTKTARQLLTQLPTDLAKQVRNAMVHLGNVTTEERQKALATFQQMTGGGDPSRRKPSPAEAVLGQAHPSIDRVELSHEAAEQARDREGEADLRETDIYRDPTSPEVHGESPELHQWHQLDCHDLAELLSVERPIVVAVVLNQIPVPLAASLLQLIPRSLSMEAISFIPKLQTTPSDILQEIHQHLHQCIESYQLPKKSSEQNLRKIQAILEAAPGNFREECKRNISQSQPHIARKLGWSVPMRQATVYSNSASTEAESSSNDSLNTETKELHPAESLLASEWPKDSGRTIDRGTKDQGTLHTESASTRKESRSTNEEPKDILPFVHPKSSPHGTEVAVPLTAEKMPVVRMSFEEVATLPRSDLAKVLRASDPLVILLALSGAPEHVYARVQSMLHPKDVKRLDAKLKTMGPIQLQDVDRAQRMISERAAQMLASGQIGSLINMTITAAA